MTELEERRPFAVIDWFTPESGYGGSPVVLHRNAALAFVPSGKLLLRIEVDTPEEKRKNEEDALVWFTQQIEIICQEMLAFSGTSSGSESYLSVTQIELFIRPYRSDVKDRVTKGDFFSVVLVISWGI